MRNSRSQHSLEDLGHRVTIVITLKEAGYVSISSITWMAVIERKNTKDSGLYLTRVKERAQYYSIKAVLQISQLSSIISEDCSYQADDNRGRTDSSEEILFHFIVTFHFRDILGSQVQEAGRENCSKEARGRGPKIYRSFAIKGRQSEEAV